MPGQRFRKGRDRHETNGSSSNRRPDLGRGDVCSGRAGRAGSIRRPAPGLRPDVGWAIRAGCAARTIRADRPASELREHAARCHPYGDAQRGATANGVSLGRTPGTRRVSGAGTPPHLDQNGADHRRLNGVGRRRRRDGWWKERGVGRCSARWRRSFDIRGNSPPITTRRRQTGAGFTSRLFLRVRQAWRAAS
jgi:hypothetical protein